MFYNFLLNVEDADVRKQFLETLNDADKCLFRCNRCVYKKRCLYKKIYGQMPFTSFCKFGGWGTLQYLTSEVHQFGWDSVLKFESVFDKIYESMFETGTFGNSILFYSDTNNYKHLNLLAQASVLHFIDVCAINLLNFDWVSDTQVALFVTVEEMSQAFSNDKIDKWLKIPCLVVFGNFDAFRQASRFGLNYQILKERQERGLCNFVFNSTYDSTYGKDRLDLLFDSFGSVIDIDALGDKNG